MIVDTSVLQMVLVASVVLAQIWDALIAKFPFWERLSDLGRELGGYAIMFINGALIWSTGFDMLPGFGVGWPLLGRVLTCVVGAIGPSLAYDLLIDKSKPTD